jgi:hypothetical protein
LDKYTAIFMVGLVETTTKETPLEVASWVEVKVNAIYLGPGAERSCYRVSRVSAVNTLKNEK